VGVNPAGELIYMLCADRLLGCLQFKQDPYRQRYKGYHENIEASESTSTTTNKDLLEKILKDNPGFEVFSDEPNTDGLSETKTDGLFKTNTDGLFETKTDGLFETNTDGLFKTD